MNATDIVKEAFDRLPGLVTKAVQDLEPGRLRQAVAPGANTIAWLVWHLTRIQDSHVAELLGETQVYLTGDWAPRFGLKPDPEDNGYGHTAEQVAAVAPESWSALVDYYTAVHERTAAYLDGLSDADYDRVVDEGWDPPVTAGVRLISVLSDDLQHAGQAAYARGLL